MPYILRKRDTGEIAAARQRNSYDLPYYGTMSWEQEADAVQALNEAANAEAGYEAAAAWEVLEVSEQRLKLFNVRLNNDPSRVLVLEVEGGLSIHKRERREE